jgi:hypothetical protein
MMAFGHPLKPHSSSFYLKHAQGEHHHYAVSTASSRTFQRKRHHGDIDEQPGGKTHHSPRLDDFEFEINPLLAGRIHAVDTDARHSTSTKRGTSHSPEQAKVKSPSRSMLPRPSTSAAHNPADASPGHFTSPPVGFKARIKLPDRPTASTSITTDDPDASLHERVRNFIGRTRTL